MYTLENECLKISVCETGAELYHIFDKEMEKEVLWYGDEAYWGRRSPLLFPNVGRNHENHCLYKGQYYDTIQHGFARDAEFACIESGKDFLTFQLCDTEETRNYFPFAFQLLVTYTLKERKLEVRWEVENKNQETMYFTIGGHPGFNVPILENTKQTDYKLLFQRKEALEYLQVYGNTGTADSSIKYTLPLEPVGEYYGCNITEHMFDNDALILDHGQVDWVGIGYPDGTPYIAMECEGFTNFGIWSLPGAPYVCLEPWMGRCDDHGFQKEISEKPDVISLEAGKTFRKSYSICVHKK